MDYQTKSIAELEDMAEHLRQQIALHPKFELEKLQLRECERWLVIKREQGQAGAKRLAANA